MEDIYSNINSLVVKLFNDILHIEEETLKRSTFENVTLNELHVIEAIGINKNRTMSEIAKLLHVTLGTLTTSVNNLVKKDLASRLKDENDRRLVYIELTHRGRVLYKLHEKFHVNMVQNIVKNLDEIEQVNLSNSLEKLTRFLIEYEQKILEN